MVATIRMAGHWAIETPPGSYIAGDRFSIDWTSQCRQIKKRIAQKMVWNRRNRGLGIVCVHVGLNILLYYPLPVLYVLSKSIYTHNYHPCDHFRYFPWVCTWKVLPKTPITKKLRRGKKGLPSQAGTLFNNNTPKMQKKVCTEIQKTDGELK